MAYISRECVACTHPTKRIAGKFGATDEQGKSFSGTMFECDNFKCPINRKRIKTVKILTCKAPKANEAEKAPYYKCR